jgi:hypothetical protein
MKSKIRISALVALLVFMSATMANAQNRRFSRVNTRMSYPGQCLDIPGLTDVQKQKITEINTAHQKTIDEMRQQFWAAEDITLANEIKAKMTLEQNNHLKKVSAVLDEEQMQFFNDNIMTGPAGRGRAYSNAGGRGRGYGAANRPGRGRFAAGRGGRGGAYYWR